MEVDALLAAAKAKHDAKWREDMLGLLVVGGFIALPLLAAKYPDQALAIISWIERIFVKKPTPESGSTAKASPETEAPSATSSAPPPRRRWRKTPAPPASSESTPLGYPAAARTHGEVSRTPEERASPDLSSFRAERLTNEHNASTMAGAAFVSV